MNNTNKITMRSKKKEQIVYVAVIEDRHEDVSVNLFHSLEGAKEFIDKELKNIDSSELIEEFYPDCLYHVNYSIEGDYAYIIERKING